MTLTIGRGVACQNLQRYRITGYNQCSDTVLVSKYKKKKNHFIGIFNNNNNNTIVIMNNNNTIQYNIITARIFVSRHRWSWYTKRKKNHQVIMAVAQAFDKVWCKEFLMKFHEQLPNTLNLERSSISVSGPNLSCTCSTQLTFQPMTTQRLLRSPTIW